MVPPKDTPPGFYSYKHLEGADRIYLDRLRINLEHDLLTVTGLPIKLWQDVDRIKWGQEWRTAIKQGLADSAFFIPIITPGYLYSKVCREEFGKFAAFEEKRGRTDLILPLIFVRPEDFDDAEAQKKDSVVRLCLKRQFVSWEDLRGLGDEGPEYRTRLTTLSKRIRELLKTLPIASGAATHGRKTSTKTNNNRALQKKGKTTRQVKTSSKVSSGEAAKHEVVAPVQRTLYVNRLGHQGTFQTISKALEAADGGDRILVAPGHYSEAVVLNKPVVIVGEGNVGEVTIAVKDAVVVVSTTPFGRLQNLALRQNGGEKLLAVNVRAGSLEIDGCEITSASLSCIAIQPGAETRVRRSRVHGSPQSGVVFFGSAKGVVEECEVFDNGYAGIAVAGTGDVAIRSNKIHHGREGGIRIYGGARGLIEDNEIFANKLAGVTLSGSSDPTVRRNRIYDCETGGLFGNTLSGIEVSEGSVLSVSNNHVHDNKQCGVFVNGKASAVIENNVFERNGYEGAYITDAKPQVRRNRFIENGRVGIRVKADGGGIFEANEFQQNKAGDKDIEADAEENVQWKD
jgi:F-box protein 11